jgi:hypothetical protein
LNTSTPSLATAQASPNGAVSWSDFSTARCATLNLFDDLFGDEGSTSVPDAGQTPKIRRHRVKSSAQAHHTAAPQEQLALEFEPCRLCATCANFCKQPKAVVIISCAKYATTRTGPKR